MLARRVAVITACSVLAVAGVWALAQTVPPATVTPDTHPLTAAARAGRHVRIDGPRGPIHVWLPPSYHPETAATILYIHGYWDTADTAYVGHRLPEQFAMSGLNAMFIVPEAPYAQKQPINYPSIAELLQIVEAQTGVPRGMALTAVVGHSGAFRTITTWLDEPTVDQVVMIDAMYGSQDVMAAWLRASPNHRLITVGEDTLPWNEELARDIPETYIVDRVPPTYDTWPREAKTSRVVYVRAQFYHMPLVTDGIVLPALLRLLPVELTFDSPWREPLGSLPPMPDASIDAPGDGGGDAAVTP